MSLVGQERFSDGRIDPHEVRGSPLTVVGPEFAPFRGKRDIEGDLKYARGGARNRSRINRPR
jgi:hypothetical protein